MSLKWKDRLQSAVTSVAGSGLGAFTLAGALPGFRGFAASDDGQTFNNVLIVEGSAWEIRDGCVYAHSGTTLSRGTLRDSSTGSAVAFSSAATLSQTVTASDVGLLQALVSGDGIYGRSAVALGNSIVRAQGISADTMSLIEFAQIASGGALQVVANVGVNGAKSADILSVQVPLAIASGATDAIVMENSNDTASGTGVTVSQARANWRAIIETLQAAGIRPIVIGGGPRAGRPVWTYNMMLQRLCAELSVIYVNPWYRCVAAGEVWATGKTLDGTHPYAELSRIAGQDLWAAIAQHFTGTEDFPWGDTSGFLSNCLNTTNVSGVPTGWTGAAGLTHSCSEAVSGRAGNWWKLTASGISTTQVSSRTGVSLPAGSQAGDTVQLICRVRTTGFEAAGNAGNATYSMQGNIGARIQLTFTGGSAGSITLREICADTEGVATVYGTIPAGATGCNVTISVVPRTTVSGELSVQVQAQNLSLAARA